MTTTPNTTYGFSINDTEIDWIKTAVTPTRAAVAWSAFNDALKASTPHYGRRNIEIAAEHWMTIWGLVAMGALSNRYSAGERDQRIDTAGHCYRQAEGHYKFRTTGSH